MKKTLCIVLITAMLLSLMPLAVFADTTPQGTAITSAQDLATMRNGQSYYLANDITIKKSEYSDWYFPMKQQNEGDTGSWIWVNGTLDGNGHTIYYEEGVTIHGGLIRGANGVTVENLTVRQLGNVTYSGKDDGGEVSALIRRAIGTVTIENVFIYANIEMTSGNSANQGGGFVAGINKDTTTIKNCVFSGSIRKSHTDNDAKKGVAAFVGGSWGDTAPSLQIECCINYGDIESQNSVGAFFGNWRGNGTGSSVGVRSLTLKECINYGAITCTTASYYAGGMIGFHVATEGSTTALTNCINYGVVHATNTAGGFIGGLQLYNNANYTLNGNLNYGSVIAGTYYSAMIVDPSKKGGTPKKTANDNYSVAMEDKINDNNTDYKIAWTKLEDVANVVFALNAKYENKYITLSNGKITLTWAKAAGYDEQLPDLIDATLVGVQLSGTSGDVSRNVRFVSGIGEKVSGMSKVGVKIIAKDSSGNQLKVFEGETDTVYESILAGDKEVYAKDYEKTYFYTAVIKGVPTDLGTITFEVRTFHCTTSGNVIYNNPKTITVDMGELPEEYIRDGWTLLAPAYEGGTLATSTYDAGTGIDKDTSASNVNRAYMMCVSGTNKTEFEAYQEKLETCGFVLDSESTLKGADGENNLYCEYRKGNKLIYTYFNNKNGEVRIIEDQTSVAETEFEYSFAADASTVTDIYMYGMKYSEKGLNQGDTGGDANTTNNGAFYIIKQADNSVILIDGGAGLQSTAAAQAGLWSFLREITGTEKVTVACWFITHPHEDHYKLAYDVLKNYRSQIDLQRVMFNFPNPTVTGLSIHELRGDIQTNYPNVKFLKCHTGQSIHLGSIDIDILMTHEDMVNASTGKSTMTEGNSMTTVARFTMPDGTVFLNLGDFESEQEAPLFSGSKAILDKSELECDIVTVAHHGYNKVEATYKAAKAQYVLWPNYSHENFPNTYWGDQSNYRWRYQRAKDIIGWLKSANNNKDPETYYAGKNTVKLTCVNGTITATLTEPVY